MKSGQWMAVAVLAAWIGGGATGFAQVRVEKVGREKSSLDLTGLVSSAGEEGRVFQRTLEGDLRRSGWFSLAGQGKGEFRADGEAKSDGRTLDVECQVFSVADQRRVLGRRYRGSVASPRVLAHQVADDIVESITGHKGIASTRIALVGNAGGKKELYVMDADGQGLRQLTQDRSISLFPHWGSDASTLIYTSYKAGYPDLYRVDLQTGDRKMISNYSNLNAGGDVSPDGRSIAVILSGADKNPAMPKFNNPELCVRDLAGGRVTRLTRTPNAAEASPSWSPDGRRIVYVSDQAGSPQLYIISRDGGQPKRLTTRGAENTSPCWGSNGLIAYASRQGGRAIIQVINPDTLEITTPIQDAAEYDEPTWAPDGRHLAATGIQKHQSHVYLLDIVSDAPVSLTANHPGNWYCPAWSPFK